MKCFSIATAFAALALAAAPATAQSTQSAGRGGQLSGVCGQPLPLTYTLPLPLDVTPAEPLTVGIVRAEPVYLEFVLSSETRVVLMTASLSAEADPLLALFTSAGALLGSDDDSAGNLNAMLDLTLAPGTYCAQMRPYGQTGDVPLPMTLNVATGEAAEALAAQAVTTGSVDYAALCTDPALTADLGQTLAPGMGRFALSAMVPDGQRQDWRLEVLDTMDLQVDATSPQIDTVLTLVDANGGYVADNDDAPNMGTDSRITTVLQPGSYCLSLAGFSGGGGPVELVLTDEPSDPVAGPLSGACTDPSLTTDFGQPLAPGVGLYIADGTVAQNSRLDWTIDVTETVTLQIDASSTQLDTVLSLLDASGNLIEQNDDGPNMGVDSRIVRTLTPGRYCVAVEDLGGGGGALQIGITDDPAPAAADPSQIAPCSAPDITADFDRDFGPGFGGMVLPVTVAQGSRQDWNLTVADAVTLQFDAKSPAFDTVLKLYADGNVTLAENDDGPTGGTDSRFETTLPAGSYCLSLESFGGGGGAAELTVAEIDADTALRQAVERGEMLPAPDMGIEIEDLGALETALQTNAVSPDLAKWMSFTLGNEAEVRVDAISLSGSFALRLFTESGEIVAEGEGWGGLSPTRISSRLPAGRYILAMALDEGAATRLRNIMITRVGG